MKWISRALVYNPYRVALCTTEKDFCRELRRMSIPEEDWDPWVSPGADATTHFFGKKNGSVHAIIVCVKPNRKLSRAGVHALLVHEAVHVWQKARDSLRERHPSSEFEAYAIQNIAQDLMEAYDDAD